MPILHRRQRPPIARHSQRLVLQRPQFADDGQGGCSITWVDVATVWAAVEPQVSFTDAEGYRLDQTASRARARIWLRRATAYAPEPGMRFADPSGTQPPWCIETVADADGQRHHLVCLCTAEPV